MIAETSECIILGTRFFVFIFYLWCIHIIHTVYLPFYDRWFSNGFLTSPVYFFFFIKLIILLHLNTWVIIIIAFSIMRVIGNVWITWSYTIIFHNYFGFINFSVQWRLISSCLTAKWLIILPLSIIFSTSASTGCLI